MSKLTTKVLPLPLVDAHQTLRWQNRCTATAERHRNLGLLQVKRPSQGVFGLNQAQGMDMVEVAAAITTNMAQAAVIKDLR